MRRLRCALLLWISLMASLAAQAQQAPMPVERSTLRVPRVSRPPKLEDFLNSAPREAEARVTGFRQYEPGDGVPVSQPTEAYLSYDDKNLYIVFICKDNPEMIRARLSKREDVFSDDLVAVHLDTFRDRRRFYIFAATPNAIQLDGILTEGQSGADWTFDTVWHSEGRLTPDGYAVLIAIPFRSLRFLNSSAQSWGFYACRIIRRSAETSCWPYITQRVEGTAQQMATLEGLEGISPGRNMQFIPYGVFSRTRFLDQARPAFQTDTEARAGLDAKFVLHDALTLDVALNPDFSQVESDEPQVTVNQRFEVFFPEKRPFFIENAGLFQTPLNQYDRSLFFSRRITDPQYGVRMTGKLGRWALGALAMDDRAPGRLLPSTDPSHDRRAGIGILRVQREFHSQSNLGLLVTSRDFAASSNRVVSLDTRLKLNPNWVLNGQTIQTFTRELGGARLTGYGFLADLRHSGRHFTYYGLYSDRSPDFRSELGFIPRVDVRYMEQFAQYFWKPTRGPVLLFGPDVKVTLNWNHDGRLQDWIVDASFGGDFRGPTGMGCRHVNAFEVFQGLEFRRHQTDCGINTSWLKWLNINADYGWGTSINYFPGSGLPPFLANQQFAKFNWTLRPSPRIAIAETYLYTRLATRPGSTPLGYADRQSIFNDHVLRLKLNVQFTRELSLRLIGDYHALLPNANLVAGDRAKRLTADVLVTYLVNPGTAIHVGYTDTYENLDIETGTPPSLRRLRSPTTSTGRQFFVKMSYLFRF